MSLAGINDEQLLTLVRNFDRLGTRNIESLLEGHCSTPASEPTDLLVVLMH